MKKYIGFLLISCGCLFSCTSTKSTIQNIDYKAIRPKIEKNKFVLVQYATDAKYGYDKDFPINIGVASLSSENYFMNLFFNGITDEQGKPVTFEKIDTCCPVPSKHSKMGAGLLHKYKVTLSENVTKELYFNIYEKGEILCPKGFKIAP